MSILPTWPIAAGAAVLAFAAGFGIEHTRLGAQIAELQRDHATEAAQREQVRAADERAARETEQKLLQEAAFALETKQNEIAAINSRAADLADRLRQRPDRPAASGGILPAPRTACAGATGAELSSSDGIFLAGEAARADILRAALAQCYQQYQALTPAQ